MKKIFSFGEKIDGIEYKVLNENIVNIGAKIMFSLSFIAFINVIFFDNVIILVYISGFLFINFFVSVFVNPKFSPISFLAGLMNNKKPKYIGAIQKRFAWFLGLLLTLTILIISIFLLNDPSYFVLVCLLCLTCIILMGMEAFFGICIGCDIYKFLLKNNIIKAPKVKPKCSGDRCDF